MLPTSVLFKNRLFIERDSKHRRIFNNLGLTFRNSKWKNFSSQNVNPAFVQLYKKFISYLLRLLFLLLLVYYFDLFYIFNDTFNGVYFLYWSGMDLWAYWFAYFGWLSYVFLMWIVKIIQSILFYYAFSHHRSDFTSQQEHKVKLKPKVLFHKENTDLIKITKHDFKSAAVMWMLNDPTVGTELKSKFFQHSFNSPLNLKLWRMNRYFYSKLYKVSLMVKLHNRSKSYLNTNFVLLNNINLMRSNIQNCAILFSYLNPILNSSTYSNNINSFFNWTQIFKYKNKWNLYYLNQMSKASPFLTNNIIGLFSLNKINNNDLNRAWWHVNHNSNIIPFFNSIDNLIFDVKHIRWAYKYSNIHRKVLKMSHKLTLAKRILDSGFYNTSIGKRNLWLSENFNKNTKKNLFYFSSKLFYPNMINIDYNKNLFSKININNNWSYKNNFFLLNSYESSYLWFIKRLYFFNKLANNKIISNTNLLLETNLNQNINKNEYLSIYTINNMFLLQSFNLNFSEFSLLPDKNNFKMFEKYDSNFNDFAKDLIFFNNDTSLFNKTNLNLISNIVSGTYVLDDNRNPRLAYFNYLSYGANDLDLTDSEFFLNNDLLETDLNDIYIKNHLDDCFIQDLLLLNMFEIFYYFKNDKRNK